MPPSPPTHAEPAAAADPRAADPWAGAGAAKRRLQGFAPPPNRSECIDSSIGRAYRGTTSETADGTACQSWSTPTHFQYSPANYPEAGLLNSAYCRNPSGAASGPWCVTADATSCPVIFGDHCWSIDQPDPAGTSLSVDSAGVLELGSTAAHEMDAERAGAAMVWMPLPPAPWTAHVRVRLGAAGSSAAGGFTAYRGPDGAVAPFTFGVFADAGGDQVGFQSTAAGSQTMISSHGEEDLTVLPPPPPLLQLESNTGQWNEGLSKVLLFRQTVTTGTEWLWSADQLSVNPDDPTADQYSILDQLASLPRLPDGKWAFELAWPNDGLQPQVWRQSSNPVSESIAGYEAIDVPHTSKKWGGLEPSDKALMDGSVGSGWWHYAVGAFRAHGGGLPGPTNAAMSQVELYVYTRPHALWARISQSDDGTLWTAWHADGANSITPPVAGWTLSSRVAFHADAAPDRLALFQTTGGSEASTIEFDGFELSCAGGAGGASCFEAPVGACAVPMCDPIDCKADEAGFTYEGTADKTASGQACLGWTNPADQTYFDPFDPDVPSPFDAAEAPPAACRNLWNVSSGPWCVTESPRAGGDAAGPICTPGQGQNSEVHDAFSHADTGSTPDTAVEGCLAKCAEDPECAAIDVTSAVVSNACRLYKADNVPRLGEPGGQDRQYCLLHAESCLIEVCSPPPPPPPPPVDECLGEPSGHTYRGTLAVTRSGYVCQEWTSDAPHPPTYTADDYPNAGLGAHNYCRNPNLRPQGPWCYTTNPDVPWEACDLNRCDGADCKTDVQGADYRGTRAVTEGGYTCQAWSSQAPHAHPYTADDHPNAGLGDHNYCRNPDGSQSRPWCYTTDPDREYQLCDMFLCPSPSAPPPPSPPTPPAPPVPPSPPAVPAPSSPDVTPNPPSAPRIAEVQKQCVVTEDGQIHCLGLQVGSTLDDDFVREQAERRFGSPLANPQPSVSQQR